MDSPPPEKRTPLRRVLPLAKAALGVGILGYLFWYAQQEEAFDRLIEQPKNWSLLAAAFALTIAAVLLSFVRWHLITQAAELTLSLGEAVRVGALGFGLNFVAPSSIGGDFFKAVIVARGQPGRRTAAVTTIVVDRLTGLLAMLIVASCGVALLDGSGAMTSEEVSEEVRITCRLTLLAAGALILGIALLFVPGVAGAWLSKRLRRVPGVGGVAAQVIDAWAVYRRHKRRLAAALVVCLGVDLLLVSSFFCVALGLPLEAPSFVHHLLVVPLQLTAGALVPTPGGAGTREAVAELLYLGFGIDEGQGVLIAFGHSLTMLATGGLAIIYYLAKRARVRESIENTEPESAGRMPPAA